MNGFDRALASAGLYPLAAEGVRVLQVNMGRACNLACGHCHVEAGPSREEAMGQEVMDSCLRVMANERLPAVDITGGAPEMNPGYRGFVERCSAEGCLVRTRTNLAVILDEGQGDLPAFWASNGVEVIASLPYYLEDIVDRQRGKGAFAASIEALKRLNEAGYGLEGSPLALNLVYNPCGAYLPPRQAPLEADFRRELARRTGVSFTGLFTITNMPIGRFRGFLERSGNLKRYMDRLIEAFNPAAAANVMCTQTVSVGWDGRLYDCDFNQMLSVPCGFGAPSHIDAFSMGALSARRIVTGAHCFGCAAGAGSSCTGEVA